MPPLRAEASTVSIPPRERVVAKRRAKAIKAAQSSSTQKNRTKGTRKNAGKAPEPTLASTRKRRSRELAFICRSDGVHVKQVVRRPMTQTAVSRTPYLPGQNDIPGSDDESDNDSDKDSDTTDSTVLDLPLANAHVAGMDVDEEMPDSEEFDYDAEGEDDDDYMNFMATAPITHSLDTAPMNVGSTPLVGSNMSSSLERSHRWTSEPAAPDLIGNTSAEELNILFGGLDRFAEDGSLVGNQAPVDRTAFPANNPFPADTAPPSWGPWDVTNDQQRSSNSAGQGCNLPWQNVGTRNFGTTVWGDPHRSDEPFAMHQLHAAVEDTLTPPPSMFPDRHQSTDVDTSCATPIATTLSSNPFANLPTTESMFAPERPIPSLDSPPSPRSRFSKSRTRTRDLVQRTRATVNSPIIGLQTRAGSGVQSDDEDGVPVERNRSRPSTPVRLEDTDISLGDDTGPHIPITQARTRATRYLTVKVVARPITTGHYRIPTVLELRANARRALKLNHRGRKSRRGHRSGSNAEPLRVGVRHGEMTPDQRTVLPLMQYHVLRSMVFVNPWPEDREAVLRDAQYFAADLSRISSAEVMTEGFLDTVWSRLSGLRGGPLSKIELKVEQDFEVSASDKTALMKLLSCDQFLYPTVDRHPSQFFRVGALGSALEILMFQSTKNIGLVFMEDLCSPDDAIKCSDWHQKLRDRTAHSGVPPGTIALAATMMHWALEKLYIGKNISFDEKHFQPVWERYFRALVKLPHLGQLRRDLLDHLKDYYINHWPTPDMEDEEDGDVPTPAW